eukprot:CAMPEP_0118700066 /NCGR_PEP_ID=MMETSP0800-20121206/16325_1 /TAXON_ID=210618 ORGANISM="Striatella unipunctata, Strain CCMP2910" /NCGR_SAMPLE_ID=MMETSP0800 /ASSEMBLY_ACC=CAM_ASM_000638 /LENGTH=531 /DNA_ID=CAMNT_0006600507 /DNA_START=304 /DNA_END=1899 /DNA_ORIENTATION=-
MSTLEGFLLRAAETLQEQQPQRLAMGDLDNFHRCQNVIDQLKILAGHDDDEYEEDDDDKEEKGEKTNKFVPFEIIVDDPAGNSFIENPFAPKKDPNTITERYNRTATQDMAIGLQPSKEAIEAGVIDDANPTHTNVANAPQKFGHHIDMDESSRPSLAPSAGIGRQEAIMFSTSCPTCYRPAETNMCMTDIPHFKEVIIMSLLCEHCGYKSNEIKGGGAIPEYGSRIILTVNNSDDLGREVLKSDTAGVQIPELDMELDEGGLNGMYTSVEGLMNKLHDKLTEANPFGSGDSATKQHLSNDGGAFSKPSETYLRYQAFLQKLKNMADGKTFPFTLILSDPLGNSFVGPVAKDAIALALQAEQDGNNSCYDSYVDSAMVVEEYQRTFDQNEILGLNDIKTENYHEGGQYYGTDQAQELPDRIRWLDVRGPDHPHAVGKAPTENDNTVMGAGSVNFAVPAMAQRGRKAETKLQTVNDDDDDVVKELLNKAETEDENFIMNEQYEGIKEGMVFKDGAQGLGYYTDIVLSELEKS